MQHRPGRKHENADGLSRKACKQWGMSVDLGEVEETFEVSDDTEMSRRPEVVE